MCTFKQNYLHVYTKQCARLNKNMCWKTVLNDMAARQTKLITIQFNNKLTFKPRKQSYINIALGKTLSTSIDLITDNPRCN